MASPEEIEELCKTSTAEVLKAIKKVLSNNLKRELDEHSRDYDTEGITNSAIEGSRLGKQIEKYLKTLSEESGENRND